MLLSETLFYRGQALGKIQQDLFAGEVSFIPKDGSKRLAGQKWRNSQACRKAVLAHYRGKAK